MPPETNSGDLLREEFNRWADAGRGEGMEQEHLPIVLPLLARMNLAPNDNVIEVGCGSGWLAALLAEQVPQGRVVGMDVSDEMVRRARRHNDAIENTMFVIGEAGEIPWEAQFFDQALSVESAYYWPDPARGLRETFRVLREGGSAWVLINFYRENPHSRHWADVANLPMQLLAADEWCGLFRAAGFSGVGWEQIPDPTPVPETYTGCWFRDAAQLRAFRETGALLVRGVRPEP
jgi:SAM-dependent methyltransferase